MLIFGWLLIVSASSIQIRSDAVVATINRRNLSSGNALPSSDLLSSSSPILSCANSGTVNLPSGATTVRLALSPPGKMCTLTVKDKNDEDTIIPIGRSYDNHDWEAGPGIHSTLVYKCDEISCEVNLPETKNNHQNQILQLNTFEHSLPKRDEIARFFEQSTCKFVHWENLKNKICGTTVII